MAHHTIRCYACQTQFELEPEALHPYHEGLIRGQRPPRYWIRCPSCAQKNIVCLDDEAMVTPGQAPPGTTAAQG